MPVSPNDNWKPWFEHIDLCNGRPPMLLPNPVTGFFLFAAPSFATQFVNGCATTHIRQLPVLILRLGDPGAIFTVLIVLSVYGLHRYETIRGYMKHRKKLVKAPPAICTAPARHNPASAVQREFVVERLLEETLKIDYPKDLLQIQVLDDSTDETHPFTEGLVTVRALGNPIEYHHRINRHGYKAGALQQGLNTATGDFVAVFDADFLPPADF